MVKLVIEKHNGEKIVEMRSTFVPKEGEFVWLDDPVDNTNYVKVVHTVVGLDVRTKEFTVTLIVE